MPSIKINKLPVNYIFWKYFEVIPIKMLSTWGLRKALMKLHCFFCFLALRLKSTAMVMAGHSVHLTLLFPGQA